MYTEGNQPVSFVISSLSSSQQRQISVPANLRGCGTWLSTSSLSCPNLPGGRKENRKLSHRQSIVVLQSWRCTCCILSYINVYTARVACVLYRFLSGEPPVGSPLVLAALLAGHCFRVVPEVIPVAVVKLNDRYGVIVHSVFALFALLTTLGAFPVFDLLIEIRYRYASVDEICVVGLLALVPPVV